MAVVMLPHTLAKADISGAKVTGMVEATAPGTTAAYEDSGQAAPQWEIMDKRGRVHEIDISVYG
jgi:hypothetical protein